MALLEDDAVFHADFLDEVATDAPTGCWSIQKDCTGQTAVIRHNVWPGFTAYHTACSNNFGSVYVGDGLKNLEICHQL